MVKGRSGGDQGSVGGANTQRLGEGKGSQIKKGGAHSQENYEYLGVG